MNKKFIQKIGFGIKHKGFSLIEVLLGIFIFTLFSVGVFYLTMDSLDFDYKNQVENEALYYAKEGIEAVRFIRDSNFLSLTSGEYGLSSDGSSWELVSGAEVLVGGSYDYERTVTIEDVYRDDNYDISETGVLDQATKKVTVQVSFLWRNILPRSVSLQTYLTDWSGYQWLQTTCTQFDGGSYDSIKTVPDPALPADNCSLDLVVVEEPGSFYSSVEAGEHVRDVFVDGGYAYYAASKTQGGLEIADVSDVENPSVVETLDIGAKGRYLTKSGNYLYMGAESSNKGLVIVDVSSVSSPVVKSTTNVGGYGNQSSISGNYLYLGVNTSTNSFLVYDISNPSSPVKKSQLNFGASTVAVQVSGNYAYIGTNSSTNSFKIINVSNPLSPSLVGTFNFGVGVNSITLSGPFAYVGLDRSSNSFAVLNVSDVAHPASVSTLDLGNEVQDLAILGDYAYMALDAVHSGLSAVNISSPASPSIAYTMDVQGKGTSVFPYGEYIYVSVDTANNGVVIVGEAEPVVSSEGSYISQPLDTGSSDTRYDYVEWSAIVFRWSTIKFQLRTASSAPGLESATWVGPDGTSGTYYETSPTAIILDPASLGSRYIQAKVYMTSDGINPPVLQSFRIEYHP